MWLFYAMVDGYIPMGNDGEMKIPSNASRGRIWQLAEQLRAGRPGRVYLMRQWTQEMSELAPAAFCVYIARNGKVVAQS